MGCDGSWLEGCVKEAVLDAGALLVDELLIVESTFVVLDAFVLLFD